MARRLLRLAAITLLLLVVTDQLLLHIALDDDAWAGRLVAPFDPPLFNAGQHASLERLAAVASGERQLVGPLRFDAELGWAPRIGEGYDEHGARAVPRSADDKGVPASERRRIVTIGGSFTHGDEVEAGDAWPARVEQLDPSLQVFNLGVGAYGIDQALLRLQRDGLPLRPDEVWLGFMPSAALRTLNLYRPALRHHDLLVLSKPRFVLDDAGALQVVPNPAASLAELVRLASDNEVFLQAMLPHDAFVAAAPAAYSPRGSHWSHHSGLARLVITRDEGRGRDAHPRLRDGNDAVAPLIDALVHRLALVCREAGVRFRLVVLPDGKALRDAAAQGTPSWAGLAEGWRADGIEVIDVTEAVRAADAAGRADAGSKAWAPGGHYSRLTHLAVAAAILDALD